MEIKLEFIGTSTFRLAVGDLVIFHDAWLERPSSMKPVIQAEDVKKCDYILISHAHFDHLPGADILAKRTGAKIIGNGEAISVMRRCGVPESQLIPVAGGERIGVGPGIEIHPYPSLHCLLPDIPHDDLPDVLDTSAVYLGTEGCTLNITERMTKGFGSMIERDDSAFENAPAWFRSMRTWMKEKREKFSWFDGGQIMYNILLPNKKAILFSSHLGGYQSLLRSLVPKPDIAILGAAGRANLDGRPFQGSPAEFLVMELRWLGEPERVVFSLHDEGPIRPFRVNTAPARNLIEERTRTKVWDLEPGRSYQIWKESS